MEKDLKKWREKSDNFKGTSKDRDKLFEEIEKEKKDKDDNRR